VIVIGASASGEHCRVRDIGVRVALGAQPRDLLRQIVGNDALVCLLGLMNAIPNERIQFQDCPVTRD
jgi:hypothetical protein